MNNDEQWLVVRLVGQKHCHPHPFRAATRKLQIRGETLEGFKNAKLQGLRLRRSRWPSPERRSHPHPAAAASLGCSSAVPPHTANVHHITCQNGPRGAGSAWADNTRGCDGEVVTGGCGEVVTGGCGKIILEVVTEGIRGAEGVLQRGC